MKFWNTIEERLRSGQHLILLYVLQSEGSSPGRQGFKMLVGGNDWMMGSIGGGAMEHKLVELARSLLPAGRFDPFFKKQIHRSSEPKNRSGMICSGEQSVAFFYLDDSDITWVANLNKAVAEHQRAILILSNDGLSLINRKEQKKQFDELRISESKWSLREQIGYQPVLYIIGAGHISLALSSLMRQLDFRIKLFDDRAALNTMIENDQVDEKRIVDYEKIDAQLTDTNAYVALMSFGYRTDKQIIRQLLHKKMNYFGVLGSRAKMEKLFLELKEEGVNEEMLRKINTPIGLSINSRTPMEIAVSIAAEIIAVKNGLTGSVSPK